MSTPIIVDKVKPCPESWRPGDMVCGAIIGRRLAPACLSGGSDCGVIRPRMKILRVTPCSSLLAAVTDQEEAARAGGAEK